MRLLNHFDADSSRSGGGRGDPQTSRAEVPLRDLCQAAAAGDQAAFARLHDRLAGGVRQFLRKRIPSNEHLVEDLTQQTWMGLWNALQAGRYDPQRAAVSTYLYAVAYKTWLRHVRDGDAASDDLDRFAESILGAGDPADELRAAELIEAVRGCLRHRDAPTALTDEERAIVQSGAEGLSEREIASRLGIAPSTVNVRKHLAMNKLRDCMARKGHRVDPEQFGGSGK